MKKMLGKKNQKGMTLVELLAVIVILGLVAAIGTIAVGNIVDNSKTKADERKAEMIEQAARMFILDDNTPTTDGEVTITELVSNGYYEGDGTRPNGATAYTKVTITTTNGAITYNAE